MIIQVYERVLSKGDSIWQYQTIIILMKAMKCPMKALLIDFASIMGAYVSLDNASCMAQPGAITIEELQLYRRDAQLR